MRKRFFEKVYKIVKQIPLGKVSTYGQIAAKLGKPKATRAVGNALHQNPDPKNIPCHRVVNRQGRLAENYACPPSAAPKGASRRGFGGWRKQRRKLLAEGVKFKNQFHVALEKSLAKL